MVLSYILHKQQSWHRANTIKSTERYFSRACCCSLGAQDNEQGPHIGELGTWCLREGGGQCSWKAGEVLVFGFFLSPDTPGVSLTLDATRRWQVLPVEVIQLLYSSVALCWCQSYQDGWDDAESLEGLLVQGDKPHL
ncbi:hypothetical protein Hamer_G015848 [Homarus americanus]|uniref:Uncharacterized protein n=1 Tax=Homarus americanus TaxID=6706 RepID=A0A8J5MMP7_HOMAM|nr:hypothetical protein Hamer_G015848 [Homarus americanus]